MSWMEELVATGRAKMPTAGDIKFHSRPICITYQQLSSSTGYKCADGMQSDGKLIGVLNNLL